MGFIDGTIPKVEINPDKKEEWSEINSLVGSWILNTMEPILCSSVNYFGRVDKLWANLKERFWGIEGSFGELQVSGRFNKYLLLPDEENMG